MTRRASPAEGRVFPWAGIDDEQRNALLLYGLIALVIAVAAALIGWGYYKDKIAPNHGTVLSVGKRSFDVSFLERRVRANLKTGQLQSAKTLQDAVVTSLQHLELEEVARQAAKDQGLTVTDAEIDNAIRDRLGLPDGVSRDKFAALYRQQVLQVGLPVSEYREIVVAQIVQEKLTKQFRDAVADEGEQVSAQIIKNADQSKIKEAKQKLDDGNKFNVTALQYSSDDSKNTGGELGWTARGEFSPVVGDALFALPLNKASDIIQDTDGWYIVLAQDKKVAPFESDQKDRIAAKTLDNVIQQSRARFGSKTRLTEEQIVTIGRHVLGG